MANKLNLKAINKLERHTFIQKTITITIDDKEYEVKIDSAFRQTKIKDMIIKFFTSKNFKDFSELEDEGTKVLYYMFLIVKTMTDLEIPDDITLAQELNLINSLIDLGIWDAIFAEIPEGEMKKINDFLQKFNENLNEAVNQGDFIKSIENMDVGDVSE